MAGSPEVYEFGPYALDVHERRLCNAGQVVALRPKAHDVLVALVRRAGTLVTKRELLDLVWRDVSVEEGILAVYVASLRKSLGDRGETGALIETVPRAGYRFSGAVRRTRVPAEPLSMKWPIGVLPARPPRNGRRPTPRGRRRSRDRAQWRTGMPPRRAGGPNGRRS